MWKIATSLTAALLIAAAALDSAAAQSSQPAAPAAQPPAATPAPKAEPVKTVAPRRRKVRHAARHRWHRRVSFRCFGSEWRAFPTRDPNGYFYAPGRGGIC